MLLLLLKLSINIESIITVNKAINVVIGAISFDGYDSNKWDIKNGVINMLKKPKPCKNKDI